MIQKKEVNNNIVNNKSVRCGYFLHLQSEAELDYHHNLNKTELTIPWNFKRGIHDNSRTSISLNLQTEDNLKNTSLILFRENDN